MATSSTLEAQDILNEGWLTVYKSRNPTFLTKQKPDKVLERAWGVIHAKSPKGPLLSFYQDNRKENRVLRRDKVELFSVRGITKLFGHPKHSHCFTLKMKGKRNRLLFHCDSSSELEQWLRILSDVLRMEFQLEKVIWEFLDNSGLWQAISDRESCDIETHYCEQQNIFVIGETDANRCHYHLGQMQRFSSSSKHTQRLKRTPFIWEKPDTLYQKMQDLPAIWEWGDPSKDEWHPFERETNIQIEDMFDSGSQWAELTLCMPSPMLFLLNLQDMKLVNSKTQVRYCLRRIDNSANMVQELVVADDRTRTPSPDPFESSGAEHVISPTSTLFQPLQNFLQHLQVPRKNVTLKQLLGEGAFGEVYLADVTGLPGHDGVSEVAVKQLRLSDFIARHGHHSQQMEDFLREAKEMAKVDNHRVVKLIAVCTLDFPLLLIEEYMNQGDLLAVLKEARPYMPLVQQISFAWQVAEGMNYLATELQCVHRDLAARNVMVHRTDSGEMLAKIADFGLSRHLYSEMYKHSGAKPRPLPAKWMALESLMYFIFTTKSDVWSFGVLLWEIMTLGRTPYPGVENRELLEQIEEHGLKLSKPKGCPQPIYDIILDSTIHEPDERPTFSDLRDKLLALCEDAKEGRLQVSEDLEDEVNSTTKNNTNVQANTTTTTTAANEGQATTDSTTEKNKTIDKADETEPTEKEVEPNTKIETDEVSGKQESDTVNEREADIVNEKEADTANEKEDVKEDTKEDTKKNDKSVDASVQMEEIGIELDNDNALGVVCNRMSVKEVSEIGHLYYVIESEQEREDGQPPLQSELNQTASLNGSVPSKVV